MYMEDKNSSGIAFILAAVFMVIVMSYLGVTSSSSLIYYLMGAGVLGIVFYSAKSSYEDRSTISDSRKEGKLIKNVGFVGGAAAGWMTGRQLLKKERMRILIAKKKAREMYNQAKQLKKKYRKGAEASSDLENEVRETGSLGIHELAAAAGAETIARGVEGEEKASKLADEQTANAEEEIIRNHQLMNEALEENTEEAVTKLQILIKRNASLIETIVDTQKLKEKHLKTLLKNNDYVLKIMASSEESAKKVANHAQKVAKRLRREERKFFKQIVDNISSVKGSIDKLYDKASEVEKNKSLKKEDKEPIIKSITRQIQRLNGELEIRKNEETNLRKLDEYIENALKIVRNAFRALMRGPLRLNQKKLDEARKKQSPSHVIEAKIKLEISELEKQKKESIQIIKNLTPSKDKAPDIAAIGQGLVVQVEIINGALNSILELNNKFCMEDLIPIIEALRAVIANCVKVISGLDYINKAIGKIEEADQKMKEMAEKSLEGTRIKNVEKVKQGLKGIEQTEQQMAQDIEAAKGLENTEFQFDSKVDADLQQAEKDILEHANYLTGEKVRIRNNTETIVKLSESLIEKLMQRREQLNQKILDMAKFAAARAAQAQTTAKQAVREERKVA